MPDVSETVNQEEHKDMYAVIATGGKQYRVNVGDEIFIEKIEGEAGDNVKFAEVLAVSDESGLRVGSPTLDGATVEAEIVKARRSLSSSTKPRRAIAGKTAIVSRTPVSGSPKFWLDLIRRKR